MSNCTIGLGWVGVVSNCTIGLGRCCVEMHYGTGSVLCRIARWDWVGVVSNCTMGLGRFCIELYYGTGSGCIELRTVLITSVQKTRSRYYLEFVNLLIHDCEFF